MIEFFSKNSNICRQFFDYAQIIKDKNFWMIESPLVNTKNASRIKKNIKQLKIKSGRSGPSISASFYKNW